MEVQDLNIEVKMSAVNKDVTGAKKKKINKTPTRGSEGLTRLTGDEHQNNFCHVERLNLDWSAAQRDEAAEKFPKDRFSLVDGD